MSTQRYHFAVSGEIVPCRATKRKCPHFSFEAAEPREFAAGKEAAAEYRTTHTNRVHAFRFGRQTVAAFTEGDCWRLAVALHELTGWPLHAIAYTKQDDRPQEQRSFAHVFVLDPRGRAVDIEGVHALGDAYRKRYEMLPGWREDLGQANHYLALDAQRYLAHLRERDEYVQHPQFNAGHYAQLVLGQWRRKAGA